MTETDAFHEKVAWYFSSMSPLASKISLDIQAIDTLKGDSLLSYKERCLAIDKKLIFDPLNNRLNGYSNRSETSLDSLGIEEEGILYEDPILHQDHQSALILSVYPKKPEKYVYDENNFWIDEHSGSYSSCTETQARACQLEGFLKGLPQHQREHSSIRHKKYKAPVKPPVAKGNKISKSKGEIDPEFNEQEKIRQIESEVAVAEIIIQRQATITITGVSVMGGCAELVPKPKSESRSKGAETAQENLPQQKQNSDLIAELQAKLKQTKEDKGSHPNKICKPRKPPPPPPPQTSASDEMRSSASASEDTETKATTLLAANLKESQLIASEFHEISTPKENTGVTGSKKNSKGLEEEDFVVDISSPCKIATPKTGFDFLDNW